MSFIKDNGGVLAILGIAVVILGGFADWRISVKVEAALAEKGFATTDKITEIEEDIIMQKETHNKDTEEWKRRVEKIVDILLEE